MRRPLLSLAIAVSLFASLMSGTARAQQASGIAGTVRDSSGGVLPGVAVEAASPALIERVRVALTDGEGRYNIVNLPPGTYNVTFTLQGFSILRREGIVLTAGFTAPVNADLQVSTLAETITVSGETPLVDTQNVRRQTVVTSETLDVLPTSDAGGELVSRQGGRAHAVRRHERAEHDGQRGLSAQSRARLGNDAAGERHHGGRQR